MSDALFDRLLLGVGAMKAGTTWLYSLLSKHPDIHFTHEKEIEYFYARHVDPAMLSERRRLEKARRHVQFDPARANPSVLRQRLRWTAAYLDGPVDDFWYLGLFHGRRSEAWVADFSNLYAVLPAAAWNHVAAIARRVQVIYTLRAPLEQLWSHARFHLKMTGNSARLEQWDAERMYTFIRSDAIWPHVDYPAAIARIRAALPAGALRVAWYDDMCSDPAAYLRATEDFLQVEHHRYPEALLERRVNETPEHPMPAGLADRLAPDIDAMLAGLAALGIEVPGAWR